ncbi:MAG: acid phosphatase [Sciscionella sp.]|nr:acid phosphatase [Sciscionella sp.]
MKLRMLSKGPIKMAVVAAVSATLAGGAFAFASGVAPQWQNPAGSQPPNLSQVETQIKHYYGGSDTATSYSENSDWYKDVSKTIGDAKNYLSYRLGGKPAKPALVLDVDDTSEVTFNLEVAQQFGYNSAVWEKAIDDNAFDAIKPVRQLEQYADAHGVTVFYITGRPEHQRAATVNDLTSQGYTQLDHLYLKPESGQPWPSYIHCKSATCTTDEYKSYTRAYLQSQGYDILLNIGDQYSDLSCPDGSNKTSCDHADRPIKLPNPMYFLP